VRMESGDLKARSSVYKDIVFKHAVDFGKKLVRSGLTSVI